MDLIHFTLKSKNLFQSKCWENSEIQKKFCDKIFDICKFLWKEIIVKVVSEFCTLTDYTKFLLLNLKRQIKNF